MTEPDQPRQGRPAVHPVHFRTLLIDALDAALADDSEGLGAAIGHMAADGCINEGTLAATAMFGRYAVTPGVTRAAVLDLVSQTCGESDVRWVRMMGIILRAALYHDADTVWASWKAAVETLSPDDRVLLVANVFQTAADACHAAVATSVAGREPRFDVYALYALGVGNARKYSVLPLLVDITTAGVYDDLAAQDEMVNQLIRTEPEVVVAAHFVAMSALAPFVTEPEEQIVLAGGRDSGTTALLNWRDESIDGGLDAGDRAMCWAMREATAWGDDEVRNVEMVKERVRRYGGRYLLDTTVMVCAELLPSVVRVEDRRAELRAAGGPPPGHPG